MKKIILLCFSLLISITFISCKSTCKSVLRFSLYEEQSSRYPLIWLFSPKLIWKIPIGFYAKYVHAKIQRAEEKGLSADEYVMVMMPEAELMGIYYENFAGWNREKTLSLYFT